MTESDDQNRGAGIDRWLSIIANLGVLVGLVLVGIEIRDANDIAKAQMYDSVSTGFNEIDTALMTDADLSRIVPVGHATPNELSDVEKVRFIAYLSAEMNSMQRIYHAYKRGLFDEDDWNLIASQAMATLSSPGGEMFLANADFWPGFLDELRKHEPKTNDLILVDPRSGGGAVPEDPHLGDHETSTSATKHYVPSRHDGLSIHYERRGSGETTILFVHGWACDSSYWHLQMDAFSDDYHVLAIDLGGHGKSGTERADYTTDSFVADIESVVDRVEAKRLVLVGHSLAGPIVVEAARHLGDRVVGVVGVDTLWNLGAPSDAQIVEQMASFRADFVGAAQSFVRSMFIESSDPDLIETTVAAMSGIEPRIAISAMEHQMREAGRFQPNLRELQVPVTVINTTDFWPTDVDALTRAGADVQMMSGVGHFLMLEEPAEFNEYLLGVLRRIGD